MAGVPDKTCDRSPSAKEIALAESGYDAADRAVLEVTRYFFRTFAMPETQSWMMAFHRTASLFPEDTHATAGLSLMATVQAMRTSRVSTCMCNNSGCPGCSAIVSEHERQFVEVSRSVRRNQIGAARIHAMLLCEGKNTDAFIDRMVVLAAVTTAALPDEPLAGRDARRTGINGGWGNSQARRH